MKAAILFLFIFFISFSAQAQVGATITPCTEGAQNGAIDLTFPADYPHTLLSYNWYQIIGDVEVSITDTDLSDPDIIEGLLPGNYRVSLSRAGWCGGVSASFYHQWKPLVEHHFSPICRTAQFYHLLCWHWSPHSSSPTNRRS